MEHVVADQNGGQGLVKPVADPQGLFRPFVAFIGHGAQTHLADGGKSSLAAGAVGVIRQIIQGWNLQIIWETIVRINVGK